MRSILRSRRFRKAEFGLANRIERYHLDLNVDENCNNALFIFECASTRKKAGRAKRGFCEAKLLKVSLKRISGGNGIEEPPVPIPNTEVKLNCVDGTWRATSRESRTLPDFFF